MLNSGFPFNIIWCQQSGGYGLAHGNVHGVDGLRVIDAAVMPFLVSSNTNAPTIAVAERAAALILAERNRPAVAMGVATEAAV